MKLVHYEIRNENAVTQLKGSTYIGRGVSTSILAGKVTDWNLKGDGRLTGIDVEDDNWHKETIKYLDIPIKLSEGLLTVCNQTQ